MMDDGHEQSKCRFDNDFSVATSSFCLLIKYTTEDRFKYVPWNHWYQIKWKWINRKKQKRDEIYYWSLPIQGFLGFEAFSIGFPN